MTARGANKDSNEERVDFKVLVDDIATLTEKADSVADKVDLLAERMKFLWRPIDPAADATRLSTLATTISIY